MSFYKLSQIICSAQLNAHDSQTLLINVLIDNLVQLIS
jgi:hypothetical protein